MMIRHLAVTLLFFSGLTSCASYSPRQVAQPTDISLNTATNDVAVALHNLEAAYPPDKRIGLIVDEVPIEFNVTAAASDGGTQQLNLANVPLQGSGGAFGATIQGQQNANSNRGNVITVKFKNIATADMTKGAFRSGGGGRPGGDDRKTLRPAPGPSRPSTDVSPSGQTPSEPLTNTNQGASSGPGQSDCARYKCSLDNKPETRDR
jgi:hypothetical protein